MLKGFQKIHFIGVGGYGMSALARILLAKGFYISGSDLTPSNRTEALEDFGAEIYYSHEKNNILDKDLVIYSTAIPNNNPELEEAINQGTPRWHRSELLAEILNSKFGIAIAGAHGKTTTTSMLSVILEDASLDPTCIIGGEVSELNGNARAGKGEYVVAEACESDNSFLRYHPNISVITNIEADHLEHYDGSFEKLLDSYRQFIDNLEKDGCLMISCDCQYYDYLLKDIPQKHLTFGLSDKADIQGLNVTLEKGYTAFSVFEKLDGNQFDIELSVPGEHNILNALAAISVALELNIEPSVIQKALKRFTGAKRRFTHIGSYKDAVVVDDYAHHPTEIEATLKTAKEQTDNRVIAIFQPHRYSRTQFLLEDFSRSFDNADIVILNKVFAAGEEPISGVNTTTLKEKILTNSSVQKVLEIDNMDEIVDYVYKNVEKGDYVLTMGAGDIWKVAKNIVENN
ncbi:UDP-N-acetylmuramate--L-alanine ligase [Natranaerobius trueperi]|uniref:UDP-N-acetylmuramate--L-alanine ligase n=1 Tax=Natranaerobius trueperi TaxID=759412 RepID=A0A226C312_9FIRM|nr:UDP-N-acetylmuramate--L-alanine ligase [Natranaerobius trueperi]OWZ84797.1 UDP-N-acetylmuramate--L-alanine ligase [Natranaerobius trueperi]